MNNEWQTPEFIYQPLHQLRGFDLDVAANAGNAKCAKFFGQGSAFSEDALVVNWIDYGFNFWMNPPYRNAEQTAFLAKAVEQMRLGMRGSAIIPAAVETERFVEHVSHAELIEFYYPRVGFINPDTGKYQPGARWGVAAVHFGPRTTEYPQVRWINWKERAIDCGFSPRDWGEKK